MSGATENVKIVIDILTGKKAGISDALKQLKAVKDEAPKAANGLDKLTKSSEQVDNLATSFKGLVAQIGFVATATAGLKKLVDTTREFDKLSAGLTTATGSAEGAKQAFSAIQDFATKTPYDLAQVTDSFVKLVNYGLDPSERAMTSYGNTASALGKDLNQMVEAVADAQTGEFERLKEFGIKASKEGDKVSFTFRGTTTTVANSAKEIESYLIKLGENNFADAMANRMATLDGKMSNLADEWDKLALNISNAGVGEALTDAVDLGIAALEELNAMVASGELEGYLEAIATSFDGWGDDVKESVAFVAEAFENNLGDIRIDGKDTVQFLSDAFKEFPQNVKAFIGIMTVEVAAGFDKAASYAVAFKNGIKAIFNDQTISGVGAQLDKELGIINDAKGKQIDTILAERKATTDAFALKMAQAKKLREEYEVQQAAEKANNTDRLAGFKIQGEQAQKAASSSKDAERASKKAESAAKKQAEEVKKANDEKIRAASNDRIIALEQEKLEASKLGTALQRAEATIAIEKRITAEKIALKRQELAAIKSDPEASQADIIRAESELASMRLEVSRQELDGQKEIAQARLEAIGESWRKSAESVEQYKQAVTEAYALGLMETEEFNQRMILAGDSLSGGLSVGFKKATEEIKTDAEVMAQIGEQVPDQLATGFADMFTDIVSGSGSALNSFRNMALGMISLTTQLIMKQMVLRALISAGFAEGGVIGGATQALATGGRVAGFSPNDKADNVPIWATAGEFMQPVKAVRHYGLAFMEAIRTLRLPQADALRMVNGFSGRTMPPMSFRLATGGMVPSAGTASSEGNTFKGGDVKLKVTNVLHNDLMGDYVKSHSGETAILNLIKRNGSEIKSIIG